MPSPNTDTQSYIISLLSELCSHGYGELVIRVMDGKPYMAYIRRDLKLDVELAKR